MWTDGTIDEHDQFSRVLAAGGFGFDPCDDLAVGVPSEDFEGVVDVVIEGAVETLYGATRAA